MTTTRWKLNVNEKSVKHFNNEIEIWDQSDNAPADIYAVCQQLQREHNAHAALVEALQIADEWLEILADDAPHLKVDTRFKTIQAVLQLAKGV